MLTGHEKESGRPIPRTGRSQRQSKFSLSAIVLLLALLFYPALAGFRVSQWIEFRIIIGYVIAISILTFCAYWRDKRRAEAGDWRIPESTLHLAELIGGWPAAYIAQRVLRHKISKLSYQMKFWAIVAIHEAVAFDFIINWHYTRSALLLLGR